jgi:hypothetical protein
MMQGPNHSVTEDFRDDPLIVSLLRKAVATVGSPLPELDNETFDAIMENYRERNGERSATAAFSVGKFQLDTHFSKFRSGFTKVLVTCLQSQLDRLQGREAFWPALESDSPDLVPDSVIERRLAIDNLSRLIDVDASEGVRTFDVLLGQALGRTFRTLRDNPLRPAIFFHALGQSWTQASGVDSDELIILGRIGPAIAERVASLYPQMTAILRQGLGVERPSSNMMPTGSDLDGPLYSRLIDAKSKAINAFDKETVAAEGEPSQKDLPAKLQDSAPFGLARTFAVLEQVNALIEPALMNDDLSKDVRLALARMQLPLLRTVLADPTVLTLADHPLRRLLKDLLNPKVWSRSMGNSKGMHGLLMHLGVIAEMLKRDRRDAERDAMLYEHLHTQFLGLISAPAPKVGSAPTSDASTPQKAQTVAAD